MLLASHLRSQQALPTCIGRPPVASRQRWAGQGGTGGERTAQLRSRRPARVFANVTSPKLANGKPQDADVNSNTTAGLVPVAGTSFEALGQMTAVPQVWAWLEQHHGDRLAIVDPHQRPPVELTYRQVASLVRQFAAGLHSVGVRGGERVALFAENSSRWLIADQGTMLLGAADAVRGVTSIALEELRFILEVTDATAVIVQDAATLQKLLEVLPQKVTLAIVLWGDPPSGMSLEFDELLVVSFEELVRRGAGAQADFHPPHIQRSDTATLAFTSGTGGNPKGVVLTHDNLLHQMQNLEMMGVKPGDKTVTHMYGRTLEYYGYSRAATEHYTSLRHLKADLVTHKPDFFISVPLMLDALYAKAQAYISKLPQPKHAAASTLLETSIRYVRANRVVQGKAIEHALQPPTTAELAAAEALVTTLGPIHRLAQDVILDELREELGLAGWVISGGGSLAAHLEDFYEAVGIPVMVGYGLTETSPVLSVRRHNSNVRGSIGPAFPDTEICIADPITKQELPDGKQGIIMASGPGVMKEYWKLPEATAKAFPLGRDSGWFDTGDLGWRVPHGVKGSKMGGNIVITGRAKDTIVLSSGLNVEPQPLEDCLQVSPFIKFAVLLGSNKRALGALIVPNEEALADASAVAAEAEANGEGAAAQPGADLRSIIASEIHKALAHRAPHENVRAFAVLQEPFSVEDGTLTRTLKARRPAIFAKYSEQVEEVENQLR